MQKRGLQQAFGVPWKVTYCSNVSDEGLIAPGSCACVWLAGKRHDIPAGHSVLVD